MPSTIKPLALMSSGALSPLKPSSPGAPDETGTAAHGRIGV
jgi:hypothetical protein